MENTIAPIPSVRRIPLARMVNRTATILHDGLAVLSTLHVHHALSQNSERCVDGSELSYRMLSDDEKEAYAKIFKIPETPSNKYWREFEKAHDKVWDHQQFLGINWETFIRTFGIGSLYYYSKYMRLALPAMLEQMLRKNRHQSMVEFFNKMFQKYGCDRVDKDSFPNGSEIDIDRGPSMKDFL